MEVKEYRRSDAIDRLEKITNLMRMHCLEIRQLNNFLRQVSIRKVKTDRGLRIQQVRD